MSTEIPSGVPPESLTGQDVAKETGKIAKDTLQQTAVWVLAGALTKVIREGIDRLTKSGKV